MWVKICGTTNLNDALTAIGAGADAVGFVFARSKRQITHEGAEAIIRCLPEGIEKVGVFTTDDPFEVEHFMAGSGLTVAQLHTPFDAGMVRSLAGEFGGELKIIQVVAYDVHAKDRTAADGRFEAELRCALAEPAVWAILLDTAKGRTTGGTGVSFNWSDAAAIVRRVWPAGADCRLIVAGGLRPENVAEAIAALEPWGVDVVSGVEASAGLKDEAKVRAFVAEARGAMHPKNTKARQGRA